MSESGPEDPESENEDDAYYFNHLKRIKLQKGNLSKMINIARLPKDKESVQFKNKVKSDRLTGRIDDILLIIKSSLSSLDKNINELDKLVEEKDIKMVEIIKAAVDEKRMQIDEIKLKYTGITEQEKTTKMQRIRELKKQEAEETVKIQNMRDQDAAEEKQIEKEITNLVKGNEIIYQRILDRRENAAIKKKELKKDNEDMLNKMSREKNNIVAEIESLRKTLNTAREKSQNEIRGLKQDQVKLKKKIETEMKRHETDVNNSIDALQKTLEMNEGEFNKKAQDMQCFFGNMKEILNAKKNPTMRVSDSALRLV